MRITALKEVFWKYIIKREQAKKEDEKQSKDRKIRWEIKNVILLSVFLKVKLD